MAADTSERAFFVDEYKIHVEKLAHIYKIAVGLFGALAVEGCTLAKGTKLNFTTIYTSSVINPEQIEVTNSAPPEALRMFVGEDLGCLRRDTLEREIRG